MGLAQLYPFNYSEAIARALPGVWYLCLAAGLVFLTGLLDDLFGLKPWQKLLEQLIAAGMAYVAGVRIELFPGEPWGVWLSVPVSLIWIIGCTNALNLIDGLDGLAAGVGLFATTTVIIAALMNNNLELALVTVPLAGALLAFLRYNFNPASVFLGDCGSLLIGFLLGCYGVLWSHKSATILGMTAPLMAMAIPLLDVTLSVFRRFLRKQPIFGADRGHIHHRLLERGLSHRKAALLLYVICGVAAAFSLLQNVFDHEFGGVIIVLFCAATWLGVQHLGYVEFGVARQMFTKGSFRRIIDVQTRLQVFEEALERATTVDEIWSEITKVHESFGFQGVRLSLRGGSLYQYGWEESGPECAARWQLRIPLASGEYINFQGQIGSELSPISVSNFVDVLRKKLGHPTAESLISNVNANAATHATPAPSEASASIG